MKFKLSRKRKKNYKKDLATEYFNRWKKHLNKAIIEKDVIGFISCRRLLLVNKYKIKNILYKREKEEWEWFYFKKRVEVRTMEVIIIYPNYDPILQRPATNEELLKQYKEWYPNDKLSHHYCKQNRHKWDKFNSKF